MITLKDFQRAAATMLDTVIIPDGMGPIIEWLCLYFSEDPEFEKQQPSWLLTDNPSLKKGIFIMGPNGVGKTFLFEVFNRLQIFGLCKRYYSMTDGRAVAADVARHGFEAIGKYVTGDKLFNELGSEPSSGFYKNEIDSMYEVIFTREKAFCEKGQRTHITTNLNDAQLAARYDSAILSRLRGMTNIIQYGDGSSVGYDLRGFSQRINTHINYADLPYRWQNYFSLVTEIKDRVYEANKIMIMVEEIEHRLDAVKCLYPGVFGPYVDYVENFLSHIRHPQNIAQYARPIVSNQEKDNESPKGFNPLGDAVRENLKHLKKLDENTEGRC